MDHLSTLLLSLAIRNEPQCVEIDKGNFRPFHASISQKMCPNCSCTKKEWTTYTKLFEVEAVWGVVQTFPLFSNSCHLWPSVFIYFSLRLKVGKYFGLTRKQAEIEVNFQPKKTISLIETCISNFKLDSNNLLNICQKVYFSKYFNHVGYLK